MSEPRTPLLTEASVAFLLEHHDYRCTMASLTIRERLEVIESQARTEAAHPEPVGLLARLAGVKVGTKAGISEDRIERIVRDADYALRKIEEGDIENARAALRRGFQRAPIGLRAAIAAPSEVKEPTE